MSQREFSSQIAEPPQSPTVTDHDHVSIFVSAGIPTLQQLLKALKTVENWFVFGVMLKIPVSQLKKIKSSCQGEIELCKIDMLQYWLDNKLVPKWNDVILALEETDQVARGGHSNWSCTHICDRGQNGQDRNKGIVKRSRLVGAALVNGQDAPKLANYQGLTQYPGSTR